MIREYPPVGEVSEPHTDVVMLASSLRELVQTRKREKDEKDSPNNSGLWLWC